ncbi:MAG: hypothetical protein U0939_12570 [Pirellulales bacterium]
MIRSKGPSWLLVVFPAVFVGIILFGYVRRTRDLVRLEATVAEFAEADSLELQIRTTREQAETLQKQVAEQASQREALVQRWRDLGTRLSRAADRPSATDLITRILLRNQLHLVEKQRVNDELGAADDPQQQLTQRLRQPVEATFPALRSLASASEDALSVGADRAGRDAWRLSCVGTYASVRQAMQELSEVDEGVTPLRVEMEPAKLDSDLRRWKLVVAF